MSLVRQKRLDEFLPAKRKGQNWQLPENQSEFVDWILTLPEDRAPDEKTEADWAEAHGVALSTLKKWRSQDRFRLEWSKRAAAKNISVERLQVILDMLYRKAIVDNDTNAATRWLAWIEKYMPPVRVERDEEVANLSDDDLRAEIEDLLGEDLSE